MKIFVMGVPHTKTSTEFTTCAFTMKAWNLCRMLHERGHEVIHLGTEESNPICSENVAITPLGMWQELYGHPGSQFYNLETEGKYKPYHDLYARNARDAIESRCDGPFSAIVCAPWGGAQQIATEGLNQYVVESGIGYKFIWANYKVFESYAWMHMLYGQQGRFEGNGWYDCVIPNSFDPAMFEFRAKKEDYFLFIGRLNEDKGIAIAIDIAKRLGRQIKIVGQGDPTRFLAGQSHVTYIPPVGIDGRKELLAAAKAVICPSCYIEPFAGVAVEAQLAGTPVITTDWGAFAETCCHGYTGFRCRTMEQFLWAAKNIDKISPQACRDWAINNYSTSRVALMYEEYFQSLLNLSKAGWYQSNVGRTQLDWLRKDYPVSRPIDTNRPLEAPSEQDCWEEVRAWESNWWGLTWNDKWDKEIAKQATYAQLMGLPASLKLVTSTAPVRVLDVGCGPVSMALRADLGPVPDDVSHRSVGIDPLLVNDDTKKRYENAGIIFMNDKAENINPDSELFKSGFDEAWVYNCLQHVENPKSILDKLVNLKVKNIRIFEWINLPPCLGHPHTLTERMFDEAFRAPGWKRNIWKTGKLENFDGTATNEYIAIWIET